MKLFAHPLTAMVFKFYSRVCLAAVWGIILSNADDEVKIAFGAVMACLASLLLFIPVRALDEKPLSASRMALYGLLMAGEAQGVGCIVLAFLGPVSGTVLTAAIWLLGCGSMLFSAYALVMLFAKNNTEKGAGSNQ